MLQIDKENIMLVGPAGSITVPKEDEITSKLAMLYEGECEGLGPTRASKKYGYSKQRYFQLLTLYSQQGALSLQSKKRGPKSNYRRTDEVVRQVIRHRFLDSDASVKIIAQKINQCHFPISTRSVERVIEQFGLQKNYTPIDLTGQTKRLIPIERKHDAGSSRAIPPVSNGASGNFWPIKFPVPWYRKLYWPKVA